QKSLQRRAPPQLNFSTRGRFQINWQIKLSLHLERTINQKIYFDLHGLLSLVCPALLPEINCYDHDSFFIFPLLLLIFVFFLICFSLIFYFASFFTAFWIYSLGI